MSLRHQVREYPNDVVLQYCHRRRTNLHGLHARFTGHFVRAGGDCLCKVCGAEYRKHPVNPKVVDWDGVPWLHVLCDGLHVKL